MPQVKNIYPTWLQKILLNHHPQKNYSNKFKWFEIKEWKNIIKFTSVNTESYNQPFILTKL